MKRFIIIIYLYIIICIDIIIIYLDIIISLICAITCISNNSRMVE